MISNANCGAAPVGDTLIKTMTTYYTILKTPAVGELALIANETQLTGIYFLGWDHVPDMKEWTQDPKHRVLKEAARQIGDYLKGKRKEFTVPLHFAGTKFQEEVWRQIARIPFGETITYTELAERAGVPKATRAAGTATGRNPLAIIIPCHRIVGKDGGLGGFAGGLENKRRLLGVELDASWTIAERRSTR
jgi:methylated-DNA-[protein]-cysteine S-methyltransferase